MGPKLFFIHGTDFYENGQKKYYQKNVDTFSWGHRPYQHPGLKVNVGGSVSGRISATDPLTTYSILDTEYVIIHSNTSRVSVLHCKNY